MIRKDLELIQAILDKIELTAAPTAKVKKSLFVTVDGTLLKELSLDLAVHLADVGHVSSMEQSVRRMTLAQAKTLHKKWDPNRVIPKDVTLLGLQGHLTDLLKGVREASPKPVPPPRSVRRARTSSQPT
jgi:hypothetical protein